MTVFTRITVIGSLKRATVVVPSDEPIGALVPEIADLIAEPQAFGRMTLVGMLGDEVELAVSAHDQGLTDGNVFRLVSVADVPPPPEVADVTDAIAETLDASRGRWNPLHRAVAGGAALGALSLTATLTTMNEAAWVATAVCAVFTVLAAVTGRMASPPAGMVVVAVALGAVPRVTLEVGTLLPPTSQSLLALVLIGLGLAWVAVGVGIGAGGMRPASVGAIVGVVLSVVGIVCLLLGLPVVGASSVLAVLVTAGLGVLPMLALNASRLTTLDDLVIAGTPSKRSTVAGRVADAYAVFGWAVYAIAAVGAVAVIALLTAGGVWPSILAAGLLLVLLLRTRVMPLAYQAWPLWVAGVAGGVVGVAANGHWSAGELIAGCAVAAVLVGVLVAVQPRAHTRVRLRRFGDLIEALAVLVMVPAVLGAFGVYELMLGAFH